MIEPCTFSLPFFLLLTQKQRDWINNILLLFPPSQALMRMGLRKVAPQNSIFLVLISYYFQTLEQNNYKSHQHLTYPEATGLMSLTFQNTPEKNQRWEKLERRLIDTTKSTH